MRGNFKIYGKFSHYIPGVAECLVLLLFLLVGALLGNLVTVAFRAIAGEEAAISYGTLAAYPIMFLPPMLYAAYKSAKSGWGSTEIKLDDGRFAPVGGFWCAVTVVVLTLSAGIATDAVNTILPPMPDWLEQTLKGMTTGPLWANFLCVSIFAPFFEEWLCRGMVLRGLLGKGMKPALAIILSALFFALIHANPWQAIPAFVIGTLLGYVYYRTGSLKLTMLMHFANNTTALVLSHIDSLKDCDSWIDVLGKEPYRICFAACILVAAMSIITIRKVKTKE